jgi:uncharacterized protein
MLGTIVNALAIIGGSIIGLLFSRGIPEHYKVTILNGVGLSVVLIGIKGSLVADNLLVVIISIVIGSLCGELARIEDRLEQLGDFLEKQVAKKNGAKGEGTFAKGFVTASLVFCVGSMAIVGSLESGLTGNHQTLFAKSVLDGVTSIIFASTMGLGVVFSAAAVFLYQGAITLTAVFMKNFLVETTIQEMTSTGGLLIMAIGLNMLGVTRIRVGNMLPAIFMPLLYFALKQWLW